jgi:type II secretory pathway pseudopilin PulG
MKRVSDRERHGAARAFTLVELLVASTIALTVMGALATLFSTFSRTASTSQAIVDMTSRMRATGHRLRQDLEGVTVKVGPWTDPASDSGYFELIEGPRSDCTDATRKILPASSLGGDPDDVLLFTTRSTASPFIGKFGYSTISAPCAEVAWFCKEAPVQPVTGVTVFTVYRKQFLVMPYVAIPPFSANALPVSIGGGLSDATLTYDISLRRDGAVLRPNSLGDLARRENRFRHQALFPFEFLPADKTDLSGALHSATFDAAENKNSSVREGEDVVLQNVLSFDVRVFDPNASFNAGANGPIFPGEPGFNAAVVSGTCGAYVDLGWNGDAPTAISAPFPPLAGITAFQSGGMLLVNRAGSPRLSPPTYDTWSSHYEVNGLDDDADGLRDEGTNGEDDDGDGVPDNRTERETSPAYPVPLRGIEVRLRCIEPTTKEIRQVTIRHAFPQN